MHLDLRAIARHARKAETDELLDRVTVFRDDMEPAALDLFEGELARRGVTRGDIESHGRDREAAVVRAADGSAVRCNFCSRPAVTRNRGWHRLFGRVPVFPRLFAYCDVHGAGGGPAVT